MNEQEKNAVILPEAAELPAEAAPQPAEKPLGYWAKIARIYQYTARGLIVLLILFVVLFAVLSPSAFSFDGLYYFVRDLGSAAALADGDDSVLYYTYGEEGMIPLAYHGGVALVHGRGIEVYKADGQRSLTVSLDMEAPRMTASRNYLAAFDLGGTSFSICNSYAELYRGTTEFPIYGITVSDTGYVAVITASDRALSQVLLYDGSYNLIQRFYRGSATVSVAISDSGRYIALLGTRASGGVLDLFMLGDSEPFTTVQLENELPLGLGFTSSTTVAVVTDRVLHTLHVDGKRYGTVSFAGNPPTAFSIGREGIAVVTAQDPTGGLSRVIRAGKKGDVTFEFTLEDVRAISLVGDALWTLSEDEVRLYRAKNGSLAATYPADAGCIGLSGIGQGDAYVFYGARAVKYSAAN